MPDPGEPKASPAGFGGGAVSGSIRRATGGDDRAYRLVCGNADWAV